MDWFSPESAHPTSAPEEEAGQSSTARVYLLFGVIVALAVATLAAVITLRTASYTTRQIPVAPLPKPPETFDAGTEVARLAQVLRYRTFAPRRTVGIDGGAYQGLHRYLSRAFPHVHRELHRETVVAYSLLYTWRGREPEAPPILLAAHIDIHPLSAAEAESWTHPPFAGRVAQDSVWGRGARGGKAATTAILAAVEALLVRGYRPKVTVLLAFSHDGQSGGANGTAGIVRRLQSREINPDFVLAPGTAVIESLPPFLQRPIALVGIAEKGAMEVELVARGETTEAAESRLALAMERILARRFPTQVSGATRTLLDYVGPELDRKARTVLANLWLTAPWVAYRLGRDPATSHLVRTILTQEALNPAAPHQAPLYGTEPPLEAARSAIRIYIAPGETVSGTEHDLHAIVRDPWVALRPRPRTAYEPTLPGHSANPAHAGFAAIARAIRSVFPESVVAPGPVPWPTAARQYEALTPNVFRFMPLTVAPDAPIRANGTDERIATDDYLRMVRFYGNLIRGLNSY